MERQKGRFKEALRLVELSNQSLNRDGSGKIEGADGASKRPDGPV
jgi:hypothetical protein